MRTILLTILAIFSAVLSSEAAEIRFRSVAHCGSGSVTLGDVAEIIPARGENAAMMESVTLFPAPVSGGQSIVSATRISETLQSRGVRVHQHRMTGASQITIYGPQNVNMIAKREHRARTVDSKLTRKMESELSEELRTYLNRCTTGGRPENAIPWELSLRLNSDQVRLLDEGGHILAIYGGKNPLIGKQEFQAELEGINPTTGRRTLLRFEAEVALPPRVVVAKRNLAKDKVLNENDIEFAFRKDVKNTNYFTSKEEVIGKAVSKHVQGGTILGTAHVQSPVLVRKNDVVTVYARIGGIEVKSTAKALEDGTYGDPIALEQLLKEKPKRGRAISRDKESSTFIARVTGTGTAEVFAR